MKHHERNISELGLSTLKELLVRIEGTEVVQQFYAAFFISLVRTPPDPSPHFEND